VVLHLDRFILLRFHFTIKRILWEKKRNKHTLNFKNLRNKKMHKTMLLGLCAGLPLDPLPENNKRNKDIAHAAKRVVNLTKAERQVKECFYSFIWMKITSYFFCYWLFFFREIETFSSVLAYMITFLSIPDFSLRIKIWFGNRIR